MSDLEPPPGPPPVDEVSSAEATEAPEAMASEPTPLKSPVHEVPEEGLKEQETSVEAHHETPVAPAASADEITNEPEPEADSNERRHDLELAPLPTTFDPDAEPNDSSPASQIIYNPEPENADPFGIRQDPAANDDEDRLETGEGAGAEEEEEEDYEGRMMEYITSLQQFDGGEVEEEEEEVETIEVPPDIGQGQNEVEQDADATKEVGQGPRDTENGEEENRDEQMKDGDADMPSGPSSPLTPVSDIPELPDTLSLSPIHPLHPLPDMSSSSFKLPSDTIRDPTSAPVPHAESSSAAARRSTSPLIGASTLASPSDVRPKVGTKRPRWSIGTAPANGHTGKGKSKEVDDDLVSISDKDELREITVADFGVAKGKEDKGGKRQVKRARGSNGAAIKGPGSKKRMDAASGIRTSDKPPENINPRPKAFSDAMIKKFLAGKTREVQLAQCQRPRYAIWGKCTQCIAKVGGDSCRFRDFRTFQIDPETSDILAPGWFESTEWKEETTPLPTVFNRKFEEEHIVRTERTVAAMLLPLITTELRHVVSKKSIQRGMDAAKHRSVCDFCSSTIFGGWFFCKRCGRDYCLHCERYFPDSLETMTQSPWPLPDAARPRLLKCHHIVPPGGRQPKNPAFHDRADLQPVSRFNEKELKEHWLKLADFVLDGQEDMEARLGFMGLKDDEEVENVLKEFPTLAHQPSIDPTLTDGDKGPKEGKEFRYTKSSYPTAIPFPDPANLEDESREFLFAHIDDLSNEVFDVMWSKGEPIVVDGVGKRLRLDWEPDTFIERFGDEQCFVVDCQSNAPRQTSVGEFFELFKDGEGRGKDILKLKDWPSTDDFQNTHPELYNDFCDALPVPDFTRREGVLNLYAHFPPGPTRPDIGPKMYNAFEAVESTGGFGSTRLHMDVADAVNLLTYASKRADGAAGCAVWDLFRAEDADLIREFLRDKFEKTHLFTDPIHSQLFYLDASLRRELFEKKGVKGWRVYQYPGQAVFIPAGCAHQVCNLADCIKIALDFVSPHNVRRCQQLTQDFRKENFVKAWKEDVLQLYNVLWYAWLSCQETRQRRIREAQEEEKALAARVAHLASLRSGQHETYETYGRIGSPMSSSTGERGFGLGGWNVSSVRDEPPMASRSPSVSVSAPASRGGSPSPLPSTTLARAMVDAADSGERDGSGADSGKGKDQVPKPDNEAEEATKDGDEEAGDRKKESEDRRRLAESLMALTLTREAPSPSEVFLPSSALWGNKKPIVPPSHIGVGAGAGADPGPSGSTGTAKVGDDSKPSPSPSPSRAPSLAPPSSATTTTSRQSVVAREKVAEKKEREKQERRAKHPPRGLRTSTLIKLGAKRLEEVLDLAKGEMGGEPVLGLGLGSGHAAGQSEGSLVGLGMEAWSGLGSGSGRASPSLPPAIPTADKRAQGLSGNDIEQDQDVAHAQRSEAEDGDGDNPMTVDREMQMDIASIQAFAEGEDEGDGEGEGYEELDMGSIRGLLADDGDGHGVEEQGGGEVQPGEEADEMGSGAEMGAGTEAEAEVDGGGELAAQLSMLQQTEEDLDADIDMILDMGGGNGYGDGGMAQGEDLGVGVAATQDEGGA